MVPRAMPARPWRDRNTSPDRNHRSPSTNALERRATEPGAQQRHAHAELAHREDQREEGRTGRQLQGHGVARLKSPHAPPVRDALHQRVELAVGECTIVGAHHHPRRRDLYAPRPPLRERRIGGSCRDLRLHLAQSGLGFIGSGQALIAHVRHAGTLPHPSRVECLRVPRAGEDAPRAPRETAVRAIVVPIRLATTPAADRRKTRLRFEQGRKP